MRVTCCANRLGQLAVEIHAASVATQTFQGGCGGGRWRPPLAAVLLAGAVVRGGTVRRNPNGRAQRRIPAGAEPFPRAHDPIPAAQAILQAPEDVFVDAWGTSSSVSGTGTVWYEVAPGGAH
jgi:hypothetical protein